MMHQRFISGRVLLARTLALVGLIIVVGCGPLISFGENGPAPQSYSLRYPASFAEVSATGPAIYLDSPIMVGGLDSEAISVRLANNERTVLEGARWSLHASELLRDYIQHSLGALSNMQVVGEGGLDVRVGCRLGVKVWAMELVPGETSADDHVEVALQFSLIRLTDSKLLGQPVFNESTPVDTATPDSVVQAFSRALERSAARYGTWLKGQSEACAL